MNNQQRINQLTLLSQQIKQFKPQNTKLIQQPTHYKVQIQQQQQQIINYKINTSPIAIANQLTKQNQQNYNISRLSTQLAVCKNNFRAYFNIVKNILIRNSSRENSTDQKLINDLREVQVNDDGKIQRGMEIVIRMLDKLAGENTRLRMQLLAKQDVSNESFSLIETRVEKNITTHAIDEIERLRHSKSSSTHSRCNSIITDNNNQTPFLLTQNLSHQLKSKEQIILRLSQLLENKQVQIQKLNISFKQKQQQVLQLSQLETKNSHQLQELKFILQQRDYSLKQVQQQMELKQQSVYKLQIQLNKIQQQSEQSKKQNSILKETIQYLQRQVNDLKQQNGSIIEHISKLQQKQGQYQQVIALRESEIIQMKSTLNQYETGYKQLEKKYFDYQIQQIQHSSNQQISKQQKGLQLQDDLHLQLIFKCNQQQSNEKYKQVYSSCTVSNDQQQNLLQQRINNLQQQIIQLQFQLNKYQLLITSFQNEGTTSPRSININPSILLNQLQMLQGFQQYLTASPYKLLSTQRYRLSTERSLKQQHSINQLLPSSLLSSLQLAPETQRKLHHHDLKQRQKIEDDQRSTPQDEDHFVNKNENRLSQSVSRLIELQQFIDEQAYILAQSQLQLANTKKQLIQLNLLLNQQHATVEEKELQINHLHQHIRRRHQKHQLEVKAINTLFLQLQIQSQCKDELIQQLNNLMVERDILLLGKSYMIKQKDILIEEKNSTIIENEIVINQMQGEIEQKTAQILDLMQSLQGLKKQSHERQQQIIKLQQQLQQSIQHNASHSSNRLIDEMKCKLVGLMQLIEQKDRYIHQIEMQKDRLLLRVGQLEMKIKQALSNNTKLSQQVTQLNHQIACMKRTINKLHSNINLLQRQKQTNLNNPTNNSSTNDQQPISYPKNSTKRQKLILRTNSPNHFNSRSCLQNTIARQKQHIYQLQKLLQEKETKSIIQSSKLQSKNNQQQKHQQNEHNQNFKYLSLQQSLKVVKQPDPLTITPNHPPNPSINIKTQTKPYTKSNNNDLNNYYRQNILPQYFNRKKSPQHFITNQQIH